MGRHIKFCIKGIVLAGIIIGLVALINRILVPKFYYDETWPTTAGYRGFYQMKDDSIDALFLGSSHATASFNPQVLYDEYGVRSYNLGGEQQSMLASYYWLREALKTQNPSVVVLDTTFLFQYMKYEPLNCEESATRKAIDSMKLSRNKLEAIADVSKYDEKQAAISFLLPNVRFHDRWMGLEQNDFRFTSMEKHYELKGYVGLGNRSGNEWYTPFNSGDSSEYFETVPLMQEYLDRIVQTCKDEKITLILTCAPTVMADISKYNTVTEYAINNSLVYIDYNESGIFYDTGMVFSEDMNDDDHANVWGAEKLTAHMGRLLTENDLVVTCSDEQWQDTAQYYQNLKSDYELKYVYDIYDYLERINNDRYTTVMAVNYDATFFMTEDVLERFRALGIGMELIQDGSYLAVIQQGETYERSDMKPVSLNCESYNGLKTIEVVSAGGGENANMCSIKMNGEELAANQIGLDIVVYSNDTMKVLDSMWFTTGIFRY